VLSWPLAAAIGEDGSVTRQYRLESWLDPRIEVRGSGVDGRGAYARASIAAGDIVIVWGGAVLTKAELASASIVLDSEHAISEDLYFMTPADEWDAPDYYLNHSCDSNLWMVDEVTLSARRDSAAGEELTADYAFWQADESFVSDWVCRCGSPLCRTRVSGRDWRLPELQARYRGHFSPFINARIARLLAPGGKRDVDRSG
jgi:hypothetical protein